MALCLFGRTRLGKTLWARSLGQHVYWNSGTTFSSCDWLGAKYLVVDDVDWEFFKCKKQLLGGQLDFVVTERYRPMMNISFGKPVIYCCNNDPRNVMSSDEMNYYDENVIFIECTGVFY